MSTRWQGVLASYPESSRVNRLSIGAEALYLRLLVLSDDYGRYHGAAHEVLGRALTRRWMAGEVRLDDVEDWLCQLETVGLARRYEIGDEAFLELVDFVTATDPKRKRARFPDPGDQTGTRRGPDGDETAPADRRQKTEDRRPKTEQGPGTSPDGEIVENSVDNFPTTGTRPFDPDQRAEVVRRLVVEGLVPAGLALNTAPEAMTLLDRGNWLGGFDLDQVTARLAQIVEVAPGASNPGGFLLHMLREDSAGKTGPITLKQRQGP